MAHVTGRTLIGAGAPPEISQVHQLIGQISTAWSEVEGLWYLIFTCLMPGARRDQIDAIFFLFETSRAQRALILTVSDVLYPPNKHTKTPHKIRKRIGELNAKTEELAGLRNAAIHGRLIEAYEDHTLQKLTPRIAPGSNRKKRNRLAGRELTSALQEISAQIVELAKDLERFLDTIAPEVEIPKELQEALDKLGLQAPGQMGEVPHPPSVG
jgi:hypothetical protein